jgi:hypothetical protein
MYLVELSEWLVHRKMIGHKCVSVRRKKQTLEEYSGNALLASILQDALKPSPIRNW